jgi:molybdate transport system regulatory protein
MNPLKENFMKISARNSFEGKITSLVDGKVNAEVEVTTPGGDRIVAVVTEGSVQSLGLAIGKPVMAFVKAPWVIVLADDSGVKFSARNQLAGTVQNIEKGAINSEIGIKLTGGTLVYAVITNEAVMELGLKPGVPASALIKASHVVLGVRD